MKKFINRLYNHQGGQLLIAVFMAVLFFTVSYLTHSVRWGLGDDAESMQVISGYFDGTPTFCAPFVNAFLGYFLLFFYNITTTIAWYAIFHIIVIFVSITVFFHLIFNIFNNKKITILFPVLICTILFWTIFLNPVLNMIFTLNSIFIGCAAICLLFLANNNKTKMRYILYCLSGAFIIISYLIRYQSGIAITCFWILTLFFILIQNFIKDKNKITLFINVIKLFLFIGLVLLISFFMHRASISIKNNYESENFSQLNHYRADFLDYKSLSFDGNEEFYESIGWDKDLYNLVKNWIFMDERYNLDSLKTISEKYEYNDGGSYPVKVYANVMIDSFLGATITAFMAALSGVVLILFILSKDKKSDLIYFLYALSTFGGFLILSLYLCINGRFPIYIYQTVALPTIIILTIVVAKLWKKGGILKDSKSNKKNIIKKICTICLALICSGVLLTTSVSLYYTYFINIDFDLGDNFLEELDDYSQQPENKENIYIKLQLMDSRLFITYDNNRVPNIGVSGGCIYGSKAYQNFINLHGYDNFYSENLFDENVYLVDVPESLSLRFDLFKTYMNNKYGEVEFVEVYRTEYLVVYDINKA